MIRRLAGRIKRKLTGATKTTDGHVAHGGGKRAHWTFVGPAIPDGYQWKTYINDV